MLASPRKSREWSKTMPKTNIGQLPGPRTIKSSRSEIVGSAVLNSTAVISFFFFVFFYPVPTDQPPLDWYFLALHRPFLRYPRDRGIPAKAWSNSWGLTSFCEPLNILNLGLTSLTSDLFGDLMIYIFDSIWYTNDILYIHHYSSLSVTYSLYIYIWIAILDSESL